LKQRHVSFTRTAQRHVAREKAWWLENRDYPEVFVEELEQALKVVAVLPGAGTLYARSPIPAVWVPEILAAEFRKFWPPRCPHLTLDSSRRQG
jgi:hypothetical protein